MGVFIDAPRPSRAADPLDAFTAFHDAIRDVAAWAECLVDDAGAASPRDARWLRSFLAGPLAWHLNDEEAFLFPRLLGTSALLDHSIESCFHERAALERAALELGRLAADLARGQRVPQAQWQDAARLFAAAADRALSYEDCVLLPTAQLRLDADARALLRGELVACERSRTWEQADAAADAAKEYPVHEVIVRGAERELRRRYTRCPRGRTVAIEACRRCPQAEGARTDDAHAPRVACAIDETPANGPRVADLMTRDLHAVEPDAPLAGAIQLMSDAGVSGLPVVDAQGRPVGMITRGDVVRSLAEHGHGRRVSDLMTHLAFFVQEDDALDKAQSLLVAEGIHRVLVVNAERVLVGVLSTLDVVRGLRPA